MRFQPDVASAILRGVEQIVTPIRATLGPIARQVAVESEFAGGAPEVLDSGGVIARRIVQLGDRQADAGAMLLRGLVCGLQDEIGDGTATAAVLFESVLRQGIKMIAAGCNPMLLRTALERKLPLILEALTRSSFAAREEQQLAQLAESACHDAEIAGQLAQIMTVIGEYGRVDVRRSYSRELRHELVQGTYWKAGVASPHFLSGVTEITLEDPAILITDLEVQTPQQLPPALEAALLAGYRAMVIMAAKCSDEVLGFLVANHTAGHFRTVAVKAPDEVLTRPEALEDLATLTGARLILGAVGDLLDKVTAADLGSARQVVVDKDHLGVIEGNSDPELRDQREQMLLHAYECAEDEQRRAQLLERLGRYVEGSATLWIGGVTERQIDARKEQAERALRCLRSAMREGVVAGGGAALLNLRQALQTTDHESVEERAATTILREAFAAPFRAIVSNAGYDPSAVIAEMGEECAGFDVRTGKRVNVVEAGILDPAAVIKAVVGSSISSAALALTIEVIVHRPKQQAQIAPE
ncbi:MAG: chaperonin GroEL [Anaerolineae bacterium]